MLANLWRGRKRVIIRHRRGIVLIHPEQTDQPREPLFGALVDLAEEGIEDVLLQSLRLIHGGNLLLELADDLLLILLVDLLEIQLLVESLDLGLESVILTSVGLVEDLALLSIAALESLVDEPRALVVLDIGTDLANDIGVSIGIEVVILNLEVLAQRDEDIMGLAEVAGGGALQVEQSQGDRQVEAVVGGLVGDDEHILLHGEVVEVDLVLGGSDQVTELTQLSLPSCLVEEIDEVGVGGVRAEVLLKNDINRRFEQEGIVNGDQTDTFLTVPAWLTTTGDRAVHNVVADQEESLEKLGEPSQNAEVFELFLGQGLLQKSQAGVGTGKTTVQLSTGNVDIEGLLEVA